MKVISVSIYYVMGVSISLYYSSQITVTVYKRLSTVSQASSLLGGRKNKNHTHNNKHKKPQSHNLVLLKKLICLDY